MKNIYDDVELLETKTNWMFTITLVLFMLTVGLYIGIWELKKEITLLNNEVESLNNSVILYMAQQDSITVRLNDAKVWLFKPEK